MGLLSGSSVYLAGAIDSSTDPNSWRNQITRDLFRPLGIKTYNPLIKPSWMSRYAKTDPSVYKKSLQTLTTNGLKDNGKVVEDEWINDDIVIGSAGMSEIRDVCLRMAADANFIICSMPKTFTVGTFEELALAKTCNKPVLFHMPDGLDISTWLPTWFSDGGWYSQFYEENYFHNWQDLYKRIKAIDSGTHKIAESKWIFATYFNNPDVLKMSEI